MDGYFGQFDNYVYHQIKIYLDNNLGGFDKHLNARHLMGSRLIESAAYCYQIWLVKLYINSAQNTLVNLIIRLVISLLCRPKVILLIGGHCIGALFPDNVFCPSTWSQSYK